MSSATSIDKLNAVLPIVAEAYSDFAEPPKITIENFAGFVRVPVGLAGPLKIQGSENTNAEFIAPLATVEPTLVSRCGRTEHGHHRHPSGLRPLLATDAARDLGVEDFVIEGELASHKKASWGNVKGQRQGARGVQVVAWGAVEQRVRRGAQMQHRAPLHRLYVGQGGPDAQRTAREQHQHRHIVAAMFIACGQDAGSVAEASWSHLTAELDWATKKLKLSLFFPSLPVGVKASLELLRCQGPGTKRRLAGLVACFALALDISTLAAIASGHFAQSHERLARGKVEESSKL
ncbi:substrate-binding domain of hmg-CoA reductase [Lizonia empirigonia]|nr:substrate-binding domain of hmg-CoA reductase [Lizonia empirigonia]